MLLSPMFVRFSRTLSVWHQYISSEGRKFDECGAVSGIRMGREHLKARLKPATVSLFPSRIPVSLPGIQLSPPQRGA
jgi:hypothetical protein